LAVVLGCTYSSFTFFLILGDKFPLQIILCHYLIAIGSLINLYVKAERCFANFWQKNLKKNPSDKAQVT